MEYKKNLITQIIVEEATPPESKKKKQKTSNRDIYKRNIYEISNSWNTWQGVRVSRKEKRFHLYNNTTHKERETHTQTQTNIDSQRDRERQAERLT